MRVCYSIVDIALDSLHLKPPVVQLLLDEVIASNTADMKEFLGDHVQAEYLKEAFSKASLAAQPERNWPMPNEVCMTSVARVFGPSRRQKQVCYHLTSVCLTYMASPAAKV